MALSACLFAAMNYFARRASPHAHWTVVAAVRAAIGAGVALAIAGLRGTRVRARPTTTMWLRSAFGTAAMICTFFALGSPALPLGDAATLFNLSPVILAILAPRFLGEQSGRRMLVALPLSVLGALLVLRPAALFGGAGALGHAALAPAIVGMGAAFFSAVAMLMLRRASEQEPTEAIAIHFSLFAATVIGCVALVVATAPEREAIPSMVGAGVCAGLAQLAMTKAYSLERAAHVGAVGYLNIAASAGLGVLLLGEHPSGTSVVGMALVVAGGGVLWVAALREGRRAH
jgi:drug/metabolite transporter (DMT)-like permease